MKEKNYITRAGFKRLTDELNWLNNVERPRVTREVSEAAAEGDRSENAAYIYGKRRLREIDRRMGFLQRRIDNAEPVDIKSLNQEKIRFGATVDVEDDDGESHSYRIVGVDEVDVKAGKISWKSPIGHALLGKALDDTVIVRIPTAEEERRRELTIVDIRYQEVDEEPWKPNATAWRPPSQDQAKVEAQAARSESESRANAESESRANAESESRASAESESRASAESESRASAESASRAPAGKKRPSAGKADKRSRRKL